MERLRRNYAVSAPVRLLPPEILSHIYTFAVSEAAQFPSQDLLSITETCRQWRRIAMGTPILWTCVNFHTDKERTKDFMGRKDFSQADYLREWVDRSGNMPLSIATVGHGVPLQEDVYDVCLSYLHRVTRLALLHVSHHIIKRFFNTDSIGKNIRQLDLGAECGENFYNIPGTSGEEWGNINLPNLETVFLHSLPADLMLHVNAPNLLHLNFARCWTCPYYLNMISKNFPKVTHLKLMSFCLHQHDSHHLSVFSTPGIPLIFPNLTHFLWLDPRQPGNPNITPFSAENINLETLSLSPNLQFGWIEVRVPTFIRPGILPNLIDLKLQVELDIHYEVARRVFSGLDKLRVLSIEKTRFNPTPPSIVNIIVALSMTKIDLSNAAEVVYATAGPPLLSLIPVQPPICPLLEMLIISDCRIHSSEVLRFACLRRHGREPVTYTPSPPGQTLESAIRHEPPRRLPGPNVMPCRITLNGCPDLPQVDRVMLPELVQAMKSMVCPHMHTHRNTILDPG